MTKSYETKLDWVQRAQSSTEASNLNQARLRNDL